MGSWRWRRTRITFLGAALAALLAAASLSGPGLAAESSTAFQLDPLQNTWLPLPQVNNLATVAMSGPVGGACDKLTWPALFTTHVKVFPKEIIKTATPLTGNIRTVTEGVAFQVPVGEVASCRMTITVLNTHPVEIRGVTVSDNFGAEVAVTGITVSQGNFSTFLTGASQKVHLDWNVGTVPAGGSAVLECIATTKLNPSGRQEYTSPGVYQLNSGAKLIYTPLGGSRCSADSGVIQVTAVSAGTTSESGVSAPAALSVQSLTIKPLTSPAPDRSPQPPVGVKCGDYLRVTLSGARYDWQIRKPGRLMAEPIAITVYANHPVTITCSGFADLASLPAGSERIPTYYTFSDTRPGTAVGNWLRAADINHWQQTTTAAQAGTTVTWNLWPRLETGAATRAGDYEDVATLTFILREGCPHVVTGGSLNLDSPGEVSWVAPIELTLPAR